MAIRLSRADQEFLSHHGISEDEVCDATGMTRAEYREYMKDEGFMVAVGVTVCLNGHQMRNRHGNCVQCRPSSLTFTKRNHQDNYVYVAHSKMGRMIKIGTSGDLVDRFDQLNIHRYGGFSDWVMLESVYCENAGRFEKHVQNLLAKFRVSGDYGARQGSCHELFRCEPTAALAALRLAMGI